MRPFKFFFTASLGIIIFFFLAKFILMALVIAAIFSIIFHIFRRVQWFLQRRHWDEFDQDDELHYENIPSGWQRKSTFNMDERFPDWTVNYRTIKIQ